jgi:peptidoglycan/LPS O-acetylase OafA/YrhL
MARFVDDRRRLGYRPALDGLRAVAVLFVVLLHSRFQAWFPGGWIGVDIFFVLSGFLITTLLLEEWATGTISLPEFWSRRILRLLPAFFAALAIFFVIALLFVHGGVRATWLSDGLAAATYRSNLVAMHYGGLSAPFLGHTWSLAFEEQFYLVWPVTLFILLKARTSRRIILVLTVAAAIASVLWSGLLISHGAPWFRIYYGPDTRAVGLLVGCAVGQLAGLGWKPGRLISAAMRSCVVPLVLLLGVVLLSLHLIWTWIYVSALPILIVLIAGLVLTLVMMPGRAVQGIFANRVAVHIGRLSYSIYLWHYPVYDAVAYLHLARGAATLIAAPVIYVMSMASYRFIEQPFAALRRSARSAVRPTVSAHDGAGVVFGQAD